MNSIRKFYSSLKLNYLNQKASLSKGWKIYYSDKLNLYLLLNLNNYIDYSISIDGYFEPKVLSAIKYFLEKKKVTTFVDVGSNIGQMSLYVAKNFSHVKVLSFEAYFKNFRQQVASMLLNNLDYSLRNIAVSDSEETLTLYLPKTQKEYDYGKFNSGMTSINLDSFREENNKFEVEAKTLTNLLKEQQGIGSNENYILIKIDVEGSELKVIEGFIDFVEQNNKIIIIIEMLFEKDFSLYDKVRQILFSTNFEMFDIDMNPINKDSSVPNQNADYVFIKD